MRLINGSPASDEGSSVDVLGIDISKAEFHACLIQGDRQSAHSFPNNAAGYRQLHRWLRNRDVTKVHACMEATGSYWLAIATDLYENDIRVSVVNPSRTALFARSQLRRTKTDSVDAQMIAQFCQTQKPHLWNPPAPQILDLRALLSYRHQLVEQRLKLKQIVSDVQSNRALQNINALHLQSLGETIDGVDEQIRATLKASADLEMRVARLESIKGFGWLTSVTIVAKLPMQQLRNAKAAAAHAGLAPSQRQSGTSVHGKERICKTGDSELRRALYMPAVVAIRHNQILMAFAARLRERGKPIKVIIVAVMRKLLVLAYTLLKDLDQPTLIASA